MRQGTRKARGALKRERSESAAAAACASIAADCLSVPRADSLPGQLLSDGETPENFAKVALHFLDAGFLYEGDRGSAPELAGRAVERWVESIVGETPNLNPMAARLAGSLEGAAGWGVGEGAESSPYSLYLGISVNDFGSIVTVGSVLKQLEAILPGLGETVFSLVELASFRTVTAFTPNVGMYHGSYLYWNGVDSEEEWREEMEACYGADWQSEDMEFFSPTMYRDSFSVKWVLAPQVRVRERKLKKLARRHPLAWVRRLCSIALHIHALLERGARLDTEDLNAEPVYPSVMLRWDDNDELTHVADDFVNRANEGCDGYTDNVAVLEIPTKKEEFIAWEQSTRMALRLYRLLSVAVDVIAEQNKEQENDRSRSDLSRNDAGALACDRAVRIEEPVRA